MLLLLLVGVASVALQLPASVQSAAAGVSSHDHVSSLIDESARGLPPPPSPSSMGTLMHIQLLHRHGDRSPVHMSPNEAQTWKGMGLQAGQLSKIGVAQLKALGSFLRKQYIHQSDTLHSRDSYCGRHRCRSRTHDDV